MPLRRYLHDARVGVQGAWRELRDNAWPRARSLHARLTHRLQRWRRSASRPGAAKRLLMIYDLATQPFSIGDILVNQAASLVLREEGKLDLVDFAVVYDPKRPACADPAFRSINEDNALFHLAGILPAAQVNPFLGSLLVFNDHQHLLQFIFDNRRRYAVWPRNWHPTLRRYHYYHLLNDVLYGYFRRHGQVPQLGCRRPLLDWARRFHAAQVRPGLAVSIQLRNNSHFHPHRNSRLEAWLALFEHCRGRYPVTFVVVGAHGEIDRRCREHPNVRLAKDHGTGIEEDLALLQTSAMHLGASSGPGFLAVFGRKPYLLTNTDLIPSLYRGLQCEGNFVRFPFAGPLQRLSLGAETAPFLIEEFERMWAALDPDAWLAEQGGELGATGALQTWLR